MRRSRLCRAHSAGQLHDSLCAVRSVGLQAHVVHTSRNVVGSRSFWIDRHDVAARAARLLQQSGDGAAAHVLHGQSYGPRLFQREADLERSGEWVGMDPLQSQHARRVFYLYGGGFEHGGAGLEERR